MKSPSFKLRRTQRGSTCGDVVRNVTKPELKWPPLRTSEPVSSVIAAMLIAFATALSAADNNVSSSTNLFGESMTNAVALGHTAWGHDDGLGSVAVTAVSSDSQILVTSHSFLTKTAAVLNEASMAANCGSEAGAQPMASLTIASSNNTQAFTSVACCSEAMAFRSDITLQAHVLTKAPSGARAQRTFRFFGEAVISGSRAGENSEWREGDATSFSRLPSNGSWAGGDAAATREPRGLRLFSWTW